MVNIWELTDEERIKSAEEKKEFGSEKFKEQDYKSAGQYYINALKDIIPIIEPNSELEPYIKSLKAACYSNLAACQLKLGQYNQVIQNCNKSLSLDDSSVKALFRRASAYLEFKNYDDTEMDIKLIFQLEPNNTAAKELAMKLKKLLSEKDKADAKAMKAFFNS